MSSLESLWKEGREGALCPLEQMRAWARRAAQEGLGDEYAVCYAAIAERVTKVDDATPSERRPGSSWTEYTRIRKGIR